MEQVLHLLFLDLSLLMLVVVGALMVTPLVLVLVVLVGVVQVLLVMVRMEQLILAGEVAAVPDSHQAMAVQALLFSATPARFNISLVAQ